MAIFNSYVSLPEGIPYQNHYYTIGDINQWSPAAFSSGCVRHPCCQLECWPLLSGWYPSVSGGCHNGHSIKPPNCTSKYEGYVGWTSFFATNPLEEYRTIAVRYKIYKMEGASYFYHLVDFSKYRILKSSLKSLQCWPSVAVDRLVWCWWYHLVI